METYFEHCRRHELHLPVNNNCFQHIQRIQAIVLMLFLQLDDILMQLTNKAIELSVHVSSHHSCHLRTASPKEYSAREKKKKKKIHFNESEWIVKFFFMFFFVLQFLLLSFDCLWFSFLPVPMREGCNFDSFGRHSCQHELTN